MNKRNNSRNTSVDVDVPSQAIPEVVSEALSTHLFENINVNDKFKRASASLCHREQYGNDRWDVTFDARITWTVIDQGRSSFQISVVTREYSQFDLECHTKRDRIIESLRQLGALATSEETTRSRSTAFGSAWWATRNELATAGYIAGDDGPDSTRLVLGIHEDGVHESKLSVPGQESWAHALVCGPTGCGKTRTVFVPNLMQRLETNMLVTEAVAGERNPPTLYNLTAGWRHTAGHKVFYFNPADLASTRINPLDSISPARDEIHKVNPERLNFFDSAVYVANVIITNTKEASPIEDKIWAQSETHLLTSLLLYAIGKRRKLTGKAEAGDLANIAHIRALLRLGPESLADKFNDCPIELGRLEYQAFLNNSSPNFRYGVVSGLMSRLNPWVNPQIATLTEVTDFDVGELKDDLWTFYLATLITRPQHKPVAILAFNYLLEMICDTRFKFPVSLLLDEFTNYGYIPEIEKKLTMTRNQELGMVLGIQHTAQVKKLYRDDADAILSQPATRIFFRPRDVRTARTISEQLGVTTVSERHQVGRQFKTTERPRKLLDESEILRLPKSQIIVFLPDGNPVRLTTWHPGQYNALFEPAPQRVKHEITRQQYEQCNDAAQRPAWTNKAKQEQRKYGSTIKPEAPPAKGSPFSDITKKRSRFDLESDAD